MPQVWLVGPSPGSHRFVAQCSDAAGSCAGVLSFTSWEPTARNSAQLASSRKREVLPAAGFTRKKRGLGQVRKEFNFQKASAARNLTLEGRNCCSVVFPLAVLGPLVQKLHNFLI